MNTSQGSVATRLRCGGIFSYRYINKCSAAAEMGDRLATTDMDRKLRGLCPFLGGGARSPSNTMWSGPRPSNLRTKWYVDPSSRLATIDVGRKLGKGLRPLFGEGELSLHLTQCSLGRAFLRTKWHLDPFGRNSHGPKIGRLRPLLGRGWVPNPHLTRIPLG